MPRIMRPVVDTIVCVACGWRAHRPTVESLPHGWRLVTRGPVCGAKGCEI